MGPTSGCRMRTVTPWQWYVRGMKSYSLTGNGLNQLIQAAFDGQRMLVTNHAGNSVSMWKATDLTPIGSFSTGAVTHPLGACSDGINFSITLQFRATSC